MSAASRSTTPRRHRLAIGFVVALFAALLTTVAAPPPTPAGASASDEAAFVGALNQVRAGVGLPALSVNGQLTTLARGHAQVMADAGEIFHADPISAGYSGPWAKLGENVGVGAGVQVLVDAFVASPGHYANIVDPSFTQVGVGVVWLEGALYTTHRFLQVPGEPPPTTTAAPPPTTTATSAPPPTTAPAPPTSAPAPAPAPLPAPTVRPERVIELVGLLELVGT